MISKIFSGRFDHRGRAGLSWPVASWIAGLFQCCGLVWCLACVCLVLGVTPSLGACDSFVRWTDSAFSTCRGHLIWGPVGLEDTLSVWPLFEVLHRCWMATLVLHFLQSMMMSKCAVFDGARFCGQFWVSLRVFVHGFRTLALVVLAMCARSFAWGQILCAQQPLDDLSNKQFWTLPTARKRAGSPLFNPRVCLRQWFFTLALFGLLRVGEASHPGPGSVPATWTLGTANPSGLNGKLDQLHHLDGDAWIFAETHLSQKGMSGLAKGLKMLHSPWKYVVPGSPCPARPGTDTGIHSGVLFASKFPARALPHAFDPESYATSRIQVVGMAVNEVWVTVGMLYELPGNAAHKQARYQTDALLAELVDRVGTQATGPRVIGGDFNFAPAELQQLQRLHDLGFREVQDLNAWRFGISAQATGRGTKRIDQMWISPELQLAFLGARVTFDYWADHAAVQASFSCPNMHTTVLSWPTPQAFPWPSQWTCQVDFDPGGDLTVEYAKFWAQVELRAKLWNQHHGVFVTKAQCGRAAVLDSKPVRQSQCAVKKARKGDLQPAYIGTSLQHARFFRQLRRLQSLCRILVKGVSSFQGKCNLDDTWRAIRCAAGFPGGFGLWWDAHELKPALGGPLPLMCPSLDFAQGLFQGFQTYVRAYERDLTSRRYQHAKARREHNLAYVFQDCKDDPLPKAETLLDRVALSVEEVREEDQSVVLVQPTPLLADVPVVIQGQVVEVVAHSEDQLWLDSVVGLSPGDVLTQERPVTSDLDILQRFADAWEPRWTKQAHVLPGQWDQICGFLDQTLRPLQWDQFEWTSDRLLQAIRHKKRTAAKGPDGVSQPDLAALPEGALQAVVRMFGAVESGSSWPAQLANGFVSSLAKRPDAAKVDEFRPVVVYSLLYRVWSSERAREALRCIAKVLPDSVQGGVPARQAKAIWYELATALEQSYFHGTSLHGLLMDIQKAFNNIPRGPLWYALSLLRFPESSLRAWAGFVSKQTRRFRVRQSVGAPLASNCGLPEGCAFSVFGMVVVDWILDLWLHAQNVPVCLRTFVDDWGLLFHDAGVFERAWTAVETFTEHLDLALDLSKTRVWSNAAAARKEFRSSPVAVACAARNLGAHQNFTRHCHNAELQKRLVKLPPVWVRLRASQGPYRHKLTAIHMMAWPRALHGISVVHLGDCHFRVLRSGAMRALRADRKGANPMLHLVSSSPLTDPEAWAILQTFRDARDLGNACQLESMLGLFSQGGEGLPHNGPTSVLLSRLHRIGWAVGGQGLVQDRFGTFSVSHVAWDELVLRFKFSWGRVLAEEVAHRPTFNGIEHVDLPELYRALHKFGPVDLVYLRCHLDGTLFTQNGRAKFDSSVSATCPWCTAKDGFHHRAWECPHFAPCRRHFTAEQLAAVGSLPSCLVDHGWPVVLPEWEIFVGLLLRADGFPRVSPVVPPVASEVSVDLFTDGSGAYPRKPKLRFAAWAMTMVPGGIGTLDNRLILAGHVNGIIQTPYRAELTAVLAAITWASQRRQHVRL